MEKNLDQLFDRLFEEYAERTLTPLRKTNKDQAEILKIAPSMLSRIRNGRVPLSHKLAESIVIELDLPKSDADKTRWELVGESSKQLRASQRESLDEDPDRFGQLRELFERVGQQRGLFFVEYRALPQTMKVPMYLYSARDAIKNGARFSLFQPFGMDFEAHPRTVRHFLEDLRDEVREIYKTYRREIVGTGTDAPWVDQQLALYERSDNHGGSGITNSRLLYAEYLINNRQERETQVWEFTRREGVEVFHRTINPSYSELFANQFFPVTTYYRKKLVLPTNAQLQKTWSELSEGQFGEPFDFSICPWVRFDDPDDRATTKPQVREKAKRSK